jgi:hypothetical protein
MLRQLVFKLFEIRNGWCLEFPASSVQ